MAFMNKQSDWNKLNSERQIKKYVSGAKKIKVYHSMFVTSKIRQMCLFILLWIYFIVLY